MKTFFPILEREPRFQTPSDNSGGASNEPTPDQLRQQVVEVTARYEAIAKQVESGALVDPNAWLKSKMDAGELYPKDRYVGLQQTFQAEQAAHKATKDALTAATAQRLELDKTLKSLQEEKATLESLSEKSTQELETLRRKATRSALIMEKFPALAPFEAKNLLPEGDEKELETKLAQFSEQIQAEREKATKDFTAGGGPRQPTGKKTEELPTGSTSQDLWKQALAALGQGNQAEYDKIYGQYLQAQAKEAMAKQ